MKKFKDMTKKERIMKVVDIIAWSMLVIIIASILVGALIYSKKSEKANAETKQTSIYNKPINYTEPLNWEELQNEIPNSYIQANYRMANNGSNNFWQAITTGRWGIIISPYENVKLIYEESYGFPNYMTVYIGVSKYYEYEGEDNIGQNLDKYTFWKASEDGNGNYIPLTTYYSNPYGNEQSYRFVYVYYTAGTEQQVAINRNDTSYWVREISKYTLWYDYYTYIEKQGDSYFNGYYYGYEIGYNEGYVNGTSQSFNPIGAIFEPVTSFLSAPLFGQFSIGSFFTVALFVTIALMFIKMFAGG